MNYTRVLHAFGGHPQTAVMPIDLARCLSLSRRQPLHPLPSMPPLKPAQRYCQSTGPAPKNSLHSPHHSSSSSSSSSQPSSTAPSEPRSCFRRDSGSLNKKRVVFADAKGLALTAVRLFIPEPSAASPALVMKPSLAKLQGQEFRLGFPQPTQDLKSFLARLRDLHVQLRSCNISEHSLRGKVCVSHESIEKAVQIKLTFDSWRSHHNIPCTFLQQQRCGGSDARSWNEGTLG
nr:PREDICTED: protein phosphatase 1 regulatory subunit 3C-B-like [Paralichthys olivaceus]